MTDSRRLIPFTMAFVLPAVAGTGCFSEVDTSDLPSADDYASWPSIDTVGDTPPHGDRLRRIYVNDVAQSYAGAGEYPLDSVLVKEIYNDSAGANLDYVAFMRRIDRAPDGGELEGRYPGRIGGWLFTMADSPGDSEIQGITCWDNCHVQAPFAGAWFDYGSLLDP